MGKHIARIGPDWIRIPLAYLYFPVCYLLMVAHAWLPPKWGGHDNRARIRELDFYLSYLGMFWIYHDGVLVPED